MKYPEDYINKIICGNALEILKEIPDESINCCICSPPYWNLRDYGVEGQLGLEKTFELYIERLCQIFDEVKRVLRKDGTCWVNLGDSYGGSGNRSGHTLETSNLNRLTIGYGATGGNQKATKGYEKSLLDIPYRFSIEMTNRGWAKRNTIIWWKPNCMPSSANDRFTVDFEYLFFFTKNNKVIFWTNEKTLACVDKKPLGTKGKEGKDWEWRLIGENYENYNTKISKEDAERYNSLKARKYRNKEIKKVSLWKGHNYWFEQQFEELNYDSFRETKRGKDQPKAKIGDLMSASVNARESLDKWKINPNGRNRRCVWKISLKGFPEAHFACVDKDTEILTIDGWKKYTDIKWYKSSPQHILVATYNLENKVIEYQPLSYIKEYDCNELVKIGNRDLDILMTKNHRNIIEKKTGVEEIVLAENLAYSDKIRVLAPVNYLENNGVGKTFAELIGWIISEGHYKKGGFIEIYQNENEKAKKIDYLLNKLEIPFTRNTRRDNQVIWYLKKSPLVGWILTNVPNKELNKFLISLPISELKSLFNGLIAGDGHIRRDDGRISFIQKNKETKDWFQILALRLGYHSIQSNKTVYLTKRTHIGIRDTNGKGKNIKIIKYNGKVWCPKTPNGTWVARRNGRIFITGNTFPEKLIEIPIKAGCPEFVCKKCGKARVKIYDSKHYPTRPYKESKYINSNETQEKQTGLRERWETIRKETGYTHCGCNADFESGIVLDPFMGAGTTALVALKQRKRFIGIEIKQEYIDMANKRVARIQQEIF